MWLHAAIITAYCMKISLKSVQPKTFLYAKGDRHPMFLLAFSRRRRKHMTSLTLW